MTSDFVPGTPPPPPPPPHEHTEDLLTPSALTVTVTVEPGARHALATVRGEIDMDDAPELLADLTAALEAGPTGLEVDLADVGFCDSSGLNALLVLHRKAAETGKTLALTALPHPIEHLLDLTGTRSLFTIRPRPTP
ncbi:STAS domain-containing protein (plasmid) [Streptomyces sp. BI20]|uniref:STAS domain-containing protein n=1 Tax=Streptomyces sp. BI20 TaxID=3403460 RepID=UPI003C74B183